MQKVEVVEEVAAPVVAAKKEEEIGKNGWLEALGSSGDPKTYFDAAPVTYRKADDLKQEAYAGGKTW